MPLLLVGLGLMNQHEAPSGRRAIQLIAVAPVAQRQAMACRTSLAEHLLAQFRMTQQAAITAECISIGKATGGKEEALKGMTDNLLLAAAAIHMQTGSRLWARPFSPDH